MKFPSLSPGLRATMRITAWLFFAAIIILGTAIAAYYYIAQTAVSGKRVIQSLGDSVVIRFDQSDIPHIQAKSQEDALFALGYLHASERSWQLEFNRRLASGRLSEILGKDTLAIDRFIRTLGIKRIAEQQYDRYSIAAKRSLQAYADGINAGNEQLGWALPIEYFLTGAKPGHWSPTDSVAWMLMMALDLGGNMQLEIDRLELSRTLSTKQIWEVMPPYIEGEPVTRVDFAKMYQDLGVFKSSSTPSGQKLNQSASQSVNQPFNQANAKLTIDHLLGGREGKGSNNWAISGKLTASGKPLLANDPHLGLTAPAIWYFAHLEAPGLNVMGGTLVGIPAVVLGRTDQFAWSFTNTGPDVQDLYIEQLDPKNPSMYRGPDGPLHFKVRQEIIDIKNEPPLRFLVKETRHGPVISDSYNRLSRTINQERFAVALRWTALDIQNQSVAGLLEMNQAQNLDTFKQALKKNYAPMQNVVMADANGAISYQAAGVAPKRTLHQGLYGVAPALGWEKQSDWAAYVPFNELPSSANPAQGWIATANQQIIADSDPNPLTADWERPGRYNRIVQLIETQTKHDLASMKAMQADTISNPSLPLLALFKASQSKHPLGTQALEMSRSFEGNMKLESTAALVFNAWADQLTRKLFSRLGNTFKDRYGDRTYRQALIWQLQDPNSPWCDDPKTQVVESCADASNDAFDKALEQLSSQFGNNPQNWVWGKAHSAVSEHHPFNAIASLKPYFNLTQPFPGDSFTINVGRLELTKSSNPYETKQAPSLRAIYDLSDLEHSLFIYQSGQSGWVQSKLYRNMTPLWGNNEYLPMQMKPEIISRQLELNTR